MRGLYMGGACGTLKHGKSVAQLSLFLLNLKSSFIQDISKITAAYFHINKLNGVLKAMTLYNYNINTFSQQSYLNKKKLQKKSVISKLCDYTAL